MELKPGYKQTEVGVIPEDWEVKKLGDLCRSIVDGTHFTPRYVNDGIPFYSVENVTANNFTDTKFISLKEHSELTKRCKPEKGDILLTRIGSLGDTKLIDWDVNASIYVSLALLKPSDQVLGDYLYRYSESSQFVRDVEKLSLVNATPKKINMGDIGNVPIPVPPLPEQRAIAAALSKVDALIASLDNLITKKRDIKQAAMQQLLTGKKRLPGFSGEWEVKKLGEIAEVDTDNLSSNTNPDYSFKYISLEDIDRGVLRGYSELVFRFAPSRARRKVKRNDILFSTVRPNLKSHLLVRDDVSDLICSTGFSVLRCNPSLAIPAYVYFHLFANDIERQIESLLTGSNYPAINGSDVKALQIPLPSLLEQQAIAAILSDMDAEIAALEQKREKTRLLKQGMMQELLTGKTRLL